MCNNFRDLYVSTYLHVPAIHIGGHPPVAAEVLLPPNTRLGISHSAAEAAVGTIDCELWITKLHRALDQAEATQLR